MLRVVLREAGDQVEQLGGKGRVGVTLALSVGYGVADSLSGFLLDLLRPSLRTSMKSRLLSRTPMPIKEWKDFEDSYRHHMLVTYALHRLPVEDQVRALHEALGNGSKGVELRVLAYLLEVEDPTLNGPRPLSRAMMGWLVTRACYPEESHHAATRVLEGLARTEEGGEELERLLEAAVSRCEHSSDEEIWLYTGLVLREVRSRKLVSFLERARSHPSAAIRGILEYFA